MGGRHAYCAVLVMFLAALGALCLAAPALASVTSTVISNGDAALGPFNDCSGRLFQSCTLRAAIQRADANGGGAILFGIGSGLQSIAVDSTGLGALPALTQPTTIDATTQPGYSGAPLIEVFGATASMTQSANGLDLEGGSSTVKGLVINRFYDAVWIGTAGGDVIVGSYLGPSSSGGGTVGNSGVGVEVLTSGNRIGGTTPAERNVISNNFVNGVDISSSASGNVVEGNYIGTTAAGTAALANSSYGVYVGGGSNTIGGTTPGARNVISGNFFEGVRVEGSSNVVEGNYVGTDPTGTAAIPNGLSGVHVDGSSNTVGGTASGARNLIAGNGEFGVELQYGTANLVEGNWIGPDATGKASLPNAADGVGVLSGPNTIGGTVSGSGNVISGNSGNGVQVFATTGATVEGNTIGLTADRSGLLGNSANGILVKNSSAVVIGGTTAAAANVIAGNHSDGVAVQAGSGETIEGNFIGTDPTGQAGLGNGADGVLINGSPANTVGGKGAAGNVISGNAGNGVHLVGAGASKNKLIGNMIGTRSGGMAALGNTLDGVFVDGAASNTIGSKSSSRNVISGNAGNGVEINGSTAKSNKLIGNDIGAGKDGSTAVANSGDGVLVTNSASGNKIGGTSAGSGDVIAFNASAGILIASGTKTAVHENAIFSNGGLGIDLAPAGVNPNDSGDGDGGANLGQNYPVLTSAQSSGGSTTITGTFNSTPSGSGFTLEFFSSSVCDPTGFGEGQTFLGSLTVATDGSGNATFTVTIPVPVANGAFVTATATSSSGNTSEFSACQPSS